MKRFLFAIMLVIVTSTVGAQVQYEPTPIATPPPMSLPPVYVPPPSRYLPSAMPTTTTPAIKILSKYQIKSAKVNGQDFTQHFTNGSAGLAIYTVGEEKTPYMILAIPGDNANSSGKMFAVTSQETPQTATSFGRTTMLFSWDFMDYPGGHKGTATVTLIKEYRPDGTYLKVRIQSNESIGEFEGISG